MEGGSGTGCKPQFFEIMLNAFNPQSLYTSWKQLYRIYTSKSRRNLQTFGWCLQFQQLHPWDSNILLLHAKTSRGTFAIGINLLRRCVSESFSIIYPFWIRRKPSQFGSCWHCCQKTTTSCEFKEGWKRDGKKRKVRAHPLIMQMYNTQGVGGRGEVVWREKGEGVLLLYTLSLHEPGDM
jgi:hypothetical protein